MKNKFHLNVMWAACPKKKTSFSIQSPFSPIDVIQEYIRPARLVGKREARNQASHE
jgi:hypothetical protein